jgi:hypothetical protein
VDGGLVRSWRSEVDSGQWTVDSDFSRATHVLFIHPIGSDGWEISGQRSWVQGFALKALGLRGQTLVVFARAAHVFLEIGISGKIKKQASGDACFGVCL